MDLMHRLADIIGLPVIHSQDRQAVLANNSHWLGYPDTCPNILGRWKIGKRSMAVVHERMRSTRGQELEGTIARAAILAPHFDEPTLSIIEVPSLSERILNRLLVFVDHFIVGHARHNVALLSQNGGYLVRLPDLQRPKRPEDCTRADAQSKHAQPASLDRHPIAFSWSDNYQRLAKFLLMQKHDLPYWRGPFGPIFSIKELSTKVGCSYGSAHNFWSAASDRGWVEDALSMGLQVTGIGDMCASLLAHAATGRNVGKVYFVQSLYNRIDGSNASAFLKSLRQIPAVIGDWAVTGSAACHAHDLAHLTGDLAMSITVPSVSAAEHLINEARLVRTSQRDAALSIIVSRTPRCTMFGAAMHNGVPVVDPWQAACDVAAFPNRGKEQAEYIARALFGVDLNG